MTWVVGMAPFFGYSLAISDICVTVGDQQFDCLQKIYRVGNFIVGGFAGSVEIGFAMLQELAGLLRQGGPDSAWDPEAVAEWWPADARKVFGRFPAATRKHGCELLLASVHPNRNAGDAPWPLSYVHIFRAPDFEGHAVPPNLAQSIGSGSVAEPCRAALQRFADDEEHRTELLMTGFHMRGGVASILTLDLTKLLQKHRPNGVSEHLHYCVVERGDVLLSTNDHDEYPDKGKIEFRMPLVASSWAELNAMLQAKGASASGAIA